MLPVCYWRTPGKTHLTVARRCDLQIDRARSAGAVTARGRARWPGGGGRRSGVPAGRGGRGGGGGRGGRGQAKQGGSEERCPECWKPGSAAGRVRGGSSATPSVGQQSLRLMMRKVARWLSPAHG